MLKLPSLSHIPTDSGIYIFKQGKDILYIGKAKNLKSRIGQYFNPGSVWKQDMLNKADDVEFMICKSENESLLLESNMIKQHKPPYNRLLKWDNSYVYIKITNHPYPQVYLTRFRTDDGAIYIWPKSNARELKKTIQRFRQFLQWRWCKDRQFDQGKLCSDFVFWLCKWRCVYNKIGTKNEEKYIIDAKKLGWKDEVKDENTHKEGIN